MIFYIFFLFLVFNFRMLKIQVYKICPNRTSKHVCKSLYGLPAYKCVVVHLAVSASIHLSAGTCVRVCTVEVMRKTLNEVLWCKFSQNLLGFIAFFVLHFCPPCCFALSYVMCRRFINIILQHVNYIIPCHV